MPKPPNARFEAEEEGDDELEEDDAPSLKRRGLGKAIAVGVVSTPSVREVVWLRRVVVFGHARRSPHPVPKL